MGVPTTIAEFLALARHSGVVDVAALDACIERHRAADSLPERPKSLARLLIRDGLLTFFQAEQFLLGKNRGFILGKYLVIERLGIGGMGIVYLCEHMAMHRRVAVKVLSSHLAEDAWSRDRFFREAQAAAALDHRNIVRAHDFDQDGDLQFLVMEYVDGTALDRIVQKRGRMDVLRSVHYIRQAAQGLQHAHEAGVVHRDIKPGNLLLNRRGVVKILDMGLARFYHDQTDAPVTPGDKKRMLGTADYLAPEQALNSHDVDIRADLYSLGATFYYILTANPPFTDRSIAQKLIAHQAREPQPIRELRPRVPEELAAIIQKMMAKDPARRYATPAEVVQALAPWARRPIAPPPEREMPKLSAAAKQPSIFRGTSSATTTSRISAAQVGTGTRGANARPATHAETLANAGTLTRVQRAAFKKSVLPPAGAPNSGADELVSIALASKPGGVPGGDSSFLLQESVLDLDAEVKRAKAAASSLAARCRAID
jgi:serine/threonine protein kinase